MILEQGNTVILEEKRHMVSFYRWGGLIRVSHTCAAEQQMITATLPHWVSSDSIRR
jgi:hypothetical protein